MFSQGFAVPMGLLVSLLKPLIKVRTSCSGLCLGSRAVLQRASLHVASSSSLDLSSGGFCPALWWQTCPFMTVTPGRCEGLRWALVTGPPAEIRGSHEQPGHGSPSFFGLSGLFLELSSSLAGHDRPPVPSRRLQFPGNETLLGVLRPSRFRPACPWRATRPTSPAADMSCGQ